MHPLPAISCSRGIQSREHTASQRYANLRGEHAYQYRDIEKAPPKIAAIAQETTPTVSATKTPMSLVVVAGVLAIGSVVVMSGATK